MLSEIYRFPLFKKFKQVLADWWNVDILIVVKKDNKFFYDSSKVLSNLAVADFLKSPAFKEYFFSSFNGVIAKNSNLIQKNYNLAWKQTGLDLMVLPLSFQNLPLNSSSQVFLVAVGFASKRKKELKQAFSYLGFSDKVIEKKTQAFKKLSASEETYMQKMLEILRDEFKLSFKPSTTSSSLNLQKQKAYPTYGFMRGCSPAMQYIFNVLKKIKNYDGYVLIEGEEGTGKRLLAKTIHHDSLRSHKSFYVQNFSVFKGRFLESVLFANHKKSPRALKHKKSLAQRLEGGTLLLNEIGHTSLEFQQQLLSFLNSSVLFNQGELKDKKYNVRIISSTSQDLKEQIKKGEFIDSLYYAISSMSVQIPPLRYRKMDIPLLVDYFLQQKSPNKHLRFSKLAFKLLYDYSWPGNTFELENEIEKVISVAQKDQTVFTEKELSYPIRNHSSELNEVLSNRSNKNLKDTLRFVEKHILLDCLRKNNWNKSRVSQILGTSRTSLIFKAKEYGLLKEGS